MNIIEKLGIKPDYDFSDLEDNIMVMSFNPHIVKEIKQQRDDMLEALYDLARHGTHGENPLSGCVCRTCVGIKIIEKITEKTWEEIKELI